MSDDTLSLFSGDLCEEGALTAVIAMGFFSFIFLGRVALHRGNKREEKKMGLTNKSLTKDHWLEDHLITPFVPSSMESYIAILFFVWFVLTIPMGISRFYDGRWTNSLLAQQGPLNLIAYAFGCKTLDIVAIPYARQGPAPAGKNPLDYSDDIDWYFTLHLCAGISWLTLGSLQIFLARSGWSQNEVVRKRAHKFFGYFLALPAFACHMIMACMMAVRNPVDQIFIIQLQYFATLLESVILVALGIMYRRKGNNEMHILRMSFAFIQSVFGSGAIRVTAWLLWLIAKFFPMNWRILIDRGVCQAQSINGYPELGIAPSQIGSAEHCWKSVFLNLATTDLLIIWLEWIFLCLPIVQFEFAKADTAATVTKFKALILMLSLFILSVAFDVPEFPVQCLIFVYAGTIRFASFRMYLHSYATAPAAPGSSWARSAHKALLMVYRIPEGEEKDHKE